MFSREESSHGPCTFNDSVISSVYPSRGMFVIFNLIADLHGFSVRSITATLFILNEIKAYKVNGKKTLH